jgi:hypothetical protein
VFCHTSFRAVDRPANGSTLSRTLLNGDIRPGHGANKPTGSPARASSHSSAVAPSRHNEPERQGRTASPEDSRSNVPSLGLHSLTGWWKSGSKMGEQVTRRVVCSQRYCRWPHRGLSPSTTRGRCAGRKEPGVGDDRK